MSWKNNSKKACVRKVDHPSEEGARRHAESLTEHKGMPAGTWRAYDCQWCEFWHVGRPPAMGGRKYPFDVALYIELGPRAYHCGVQECQGNGQANRAAILGRARKAWWRSRELV